MKKLITLISLFALLSGCSTYPVQRYASNADSVVHLRSYAGQKVNVGEFAEKENKTEIMCRAVGPIPASDGKTYARYIRDALLTELKLADVYSKSSPITISGRVNEITFDSMNPYWLIDVTVTSSNGKSFSVSEQYAYESNFMGEFACQRTAQEFVPAVQNIIHKIVTHPDFPALIKSSETASTAKPAAR